MITLIFLALFGGLVSAILAAPHGIVAAVLAAALAGNVLALMGGVAMGLWCQPQPRRNAPLKVYP